MEVQIIRSAQWRELGLRLKAAANGKAVRLALTKGIQSEVKPALRDVQRAAKSLTTKGVRGGGTKRRLRSYRERHAKGRTTTHGLRATVARSIKSRVKYSGNSVGVRVYSDTAVMPNQQRRLPAYLDNPKGWRHPVFGNRESWVRQTGDPYFYVTLRQHTQRVQDAAIKHVNDALKELQE